MVRFITTYRYAAEEEGEKEEEEDMEDSEDLTAYEDAAIDSLSLEDACKAMSDFAASSSTSSTPKFPQREMRADVNGHRGLGKEGCQKGGENDDDDDDDDGDGDGDGADF